MKHVLFILIHVLFADALHADPLKPAAQALRTRALRAYDVQKYDDAIDAFREAYQIDPQPELLYALGQAQRMNGDCRHAVEAYRAFLRADPPPQQAVWAKKNLSRCEAQLAATPPEPSPAPAMPIESPALALPPPSRRPASRDTAGHVLVALGIAGLTTGAALWGVGQHDIDAANQATGYDQFVALHAAAGNAEGERTAGIVTVCVGGALALAAAIHYAVWTRGR